MTNLYDNLLKATDNTNDITNEKYGTVTKLDNNICSVKEEESDIEHSNVPIMNGVTLKLGDQVIIGFLNNSIYNPIVLGTIARRVDESYTKEEIDEKINEIISGEINLDQYLKKEEYIADLGNHTNTSEFLKGLDNVILAITGRGEQYGNSE